MPTRTKIWWERRDLASSLAGHHYTYIYDFDEALRFVMDRIGVPHNPNLTLQKDIQRKLNYMVQRPQTTWTIGEIVGNHWQSDPEALASVEIDGIPYEFLTWFSDIYIRVAFPEIWTPGIRGGHKTAVFHTDFFRKLGRDSPDKSAEDLWNRVKKGCENPQTAEERIWGLHIIKVSPWKGERPYMELFGGGTVSKKQFQNLVSEGRRSGVKKQ